MSGKTAKCDDRKGKLILSNDRLSVDILLEGGVNPTNLRCKKTNKTYADGDYHCRCASWQRKGKPPQYLKHRVEPRSVNGSETGLDIFITGKRDDLEITHCFYMPHDGPYLEEQITVQNTGPQRLDTPGLSFGFSKVMGDEQGQLLEDVQEAQFVAIPDRREVWFGRNGEYLEYSPQQLLTQQATYRTSGPNNQTPTDKFGAEGWAWSDGESSLLIAKHNLEGMEYSLLEATEDNGRPVLQFGGAGIWHGDPEFANFLEPGGQFRFGVTRYALVDGDWKQCYYAFRDFMTENGHGIPSGFDPPIHWNELYDQPFWWSMYVRTWAHAGTPTHGGDSVNSRLAMYTLESIEEEAKKARDLGCDALYLDPGWDTMFGSCIWAAERLLTAERFIKLIKEKYGLRVSLHTPLAGWSDGFSRNATYPANAHKVSGPESFKEDRVMMELCMASPEYVRVITERLLELAKAGFAFFTFDGDSFTGPCFDPDHGHALPVTREEHGRAILKIIRAIHEKFPDIILELHPFIWAMPTYYLHEPGGPNELWGHEYMVDSMWDLLCGRAISNYYHNLAYGHPLYIHIDLRTDNEQALTFWWFASTSRHIGFGGKHPDQRVWDAHKQAMKTYRRLKRFYAQGTFYGLDETVHVHTLADEGQAVMNVFNLSEQPQTRQISFEPAEIGLPAESRIEAQGALCHPDGPTTTLQIDLPARGAAIAEIRSTRP